MAILRGTVSLKAVRQDTDLDAAGGLAQRAVRNKTQQNSGTIRLGNNRGNVLGIQYDTHNPAVGGWWTQRDKTSGHGYLTNNSTRKDIYTNGSRVFVPCAGNYGVDIAMEARCTGLVSESGNYRLTGNSFGEIDDRYRNQEMHIDVVSNTYDYLTGPQTLSLNKIITTDWMYGDRTHNYTLSLSTSRPYVTLTLRNVHKGGGGAQLTTHQFYNFVLVADF